MKRSSHTNYVYEQALVYEFKDSFFVIQRGQQGITLNPAHGPEQNPAESVKLYIKLFAACTDDELGGAVIGALDAFDTTPPDFEPWENKKLAKYMKLWLGASSQKDIDVNSRLVSVVRYLTEAKEYEITPFDSFNANPWCGPIEGKNFCFSSPSTALEIGKAIRDAFTVAKHHPAYMSKNK